MGLFIISCSIIIIYFIWFAVYYEDWGSAFSYSILLIATALILSLVISGIASDITSNIAYYEVNHYTISECVETIETMMLSIITLIWVIRVLLYVRKTAILTLCPKVKSLMSLLK